MRGLTCLGGGVTQARTSDTHEHNSPWQKAAPFPPRLETITETHQTSAEPVTPGFLPQETQLWCMSQYPLLFTHYVGLSPGGGRVEIQQNSL